jgi:hypothetical protein
MRHTASGAVDASACGKLRRIASGPALRKRAVPPRASGERINATSRLMARTVEEEPARAKSPVR